MNRSSAILEIKHVPKRTLPLRRQDGGRLMRLVYIVSHGIFSCNAMFNLNDNELATHSDYIVKTFDGYRSSN